MAKIPSPCIGVCKYRRKGHCIACSMTKTQKSMFKKLSKPSHQEAFVRLLTAQQRDMGKFHAWPTVYARKLRKKGVKLALD